MPGTGEWLLEHHSFQAWKSNTESDILFVHGRSGCGKSCLAALVIDTLQKESDSSEDRIAVAFVYCSSMDAAKITPSRLQGSILKQLCNQVPIPDIAPSIERMFDKNQGDTPSPDQLADAISAVAVSFNQTFIIIDGLDECHRLEDDKFDKFCKSLCSLAQATPSLVKVIIFSRPGYLATDHAFRSYPHLEVDSGANEGDIKQFITSVVSGEELHIRRNQTLLKYVEKELLLKAEGMFLWVALLVQTLKTARTANEIKAKMKALPQGLPGVYDFSLRRILYHKDEFSRERALKILLWVTNAKRALSKEELAEALAIEPGMSDLDEGNVVQGDDGITAECGDLIVLRDGNYHLLHSSLQDYLSNLSTLSSEHLADYRVMQTNAHRILGEACLTYLQLNKFKTGPLRSRLELEDFQRTNPFFKYAASYWGRHVAAASEDGFQDTVRAFVCSDELRELSMQQFHLDHFGPELVCPYSGSTTPLHILSIFNLVSTAKSIPDLLQLQHIHDGFKLSPLDYTLHEESKDMCIWLLQDRHESIIPAESVSAAWLPLSLAAKNNWGEVIEMLISLGYDREQRSKERKQTPLHVAAVYGCESALNALLKAKVCVDPIDSQNFTPLLDAAEGNHQKLISLLLQAGANVHHRGRQELTALHLVAINGNLPAAEELLQYGSEIDPRAGDFKSLTPLHVAAENNRTDVVRLLLSKGAQIEARNNVDSTPLLLASTSGSLAALELLISSGACLDARDKIGRSALHLTAFRGHIHVSQALLKSRNSLVNAVDEVGDLPLHSAIRGNQTQIAIFLLKSGSSAEKPNNSGYRALHLAITEGNTNLIEHLVTEFKVSLTAKTSLGLTPLHIASQFGHSEYIKWLVGEDPADAMALNDNLESALHLASKRKDSVFVKELAQQAPHLDFASLDRRKRSPLHSAADAGATDIVGFLLEQKVPSTTDANSDLPLHLAASKGHIDVVKLLLTKENINARGFFGRTALSNAAGRGDVDMVSFLLHSGANPNEPDEYNKGPLLAALKNEHSHIAELLLDNKANPVVRDKFGYTPLHRAAQSGNSRLTKRLLDEGCDGLQKSIWGITPFESAVSSGKVELIDLFLEHRYNGSNLSNNSGATVYHIAALNGCVDMFEKLIEAGKAVGADLNKSDLLGRNAMFCAAYGGHTKLLGRLLELGMSVNGPDQVIEPPLVAAASQGNVDFVSRLLELKADVELFRRWDKRTAIIAAAAFRRPKTFQKLLYYGANPLQRDAYGLNALDYASRTPGIWETLGEATRAYKQLDRSTKKITLQDTIRACTSSLLEHSPKLTLKEEAERVTLMITLTYALLTLDGDLNHQSALVCFSELGNPLESCCFTAQLQCDICRRELFREPKYVCAQCLHTGLCEACHSDYLQGAESPKSPPRGLRILEELEKDLQPIRVLADAYIPLGATFLDGAFVILTTVDDWIKKKLEAWDNWEKEYNSGQRFRIDLFPGGKFLKLIERARQIRKALENKREDISTAERECVANISDPGSDGILEEKANEISEDTPKEDGDPFSDVDQSLTKLFRKFRPDKEESPFACSGHDYLEIPSINWAEAKSCTGPFDANGRVTKEWLTELLARFTNDQVCEGQTPCVESSEMEFEELANFAEMQNIVNGPTMSMPIRTTTISELGGILHAAPPAIVELVDTASLRTDTSIEIKSAGREGSAVETSARDAEILPGGSSGKRTPGVLSKVAKNSIPPEDAITSDPSSELVTENGPLTNIGESAVSGSQKAGNSEQTMANLQRIQAIKEELTSFVTHSFGTIQNSSDNNSDEVPNGGTTGVARADLLKLLCLFQFDLAFQLVQVILLGEVRGSLFSGDKFMELLPAEMILER